MHATKNSAAKVVRVRRVAQVLSHDKCLKPVKGASVLFHEIQDGFWLERPRRSEANIHESDSQRNGNDKLQKI